MCRVHRYKPRRQQRWSISITPSSKRARTIRYGVCVFMCVCMSVCVRERNKVDLCGSSSRRPRNEREGPCSPSAFNLPLCVCVSQMWKKSRKASAGVVVKEVTIFVLLREKKGLIPELLLYSRL